MTMLNFNMVDGFPTGHKEGGSLIQSCGVG